MSNTAVRQYIGARYVPKFMGEYSPTTAYEALSVVDDGLGTSYTSKIPVPAGTPLTDTEYWVMTGSSSGAIIHLQDEIDDINALITDMQEIIATPEMFGAVGDGATDDTSALQDAINNGSVAFTPGATYLINSAITVPSNRLIEGNGATIKIADGVEIKFNENLATADAIFKLLSVHDIKIDNVVFDLNGDTLGSYTDVDWIVNAGVAIEDCYNISITNCSFTEGYTDCIWAHDTTGFINIIGNKFRHIYSEQGLRKTGVYCVSHTDGFLKVNGNVFDEPNTVSRVYGPGGIFFANINNAEANHNFVINCGRSNLHLHPVASICLYDNCRDVDVIGNFIDSIESFVRFDSCRRIKCSGNYCTYNAPLAADSAYIRASIHSETVAFGYYGDYEISDNVLVLNSSGGSSAAIGIIRVDAVSMEVKNVFIKNNYIYSDGFGVRINGYIKNITVDSNVLEGISTSGRCLVQCVNGGENLNIVNNRFKYGCVDLTREGAVNTLNKCVVANNIIEAHINKTIDMNNANDVIVADNMMSGRGFRMSNSTCNRIMVHDNSLTDVDAGQTEYYVGTSALQHDNYLNGASYPTFQ